MPAWRKDEFVTRVRIAYANLPPHLFQVATLFPSREKLDLPEKPRPARMPKKARYIPDQQKGL